MNSAAPHADKQPAGGTTRRVEPLLLDLREAAEALSVSARTLKRMDHASELPQGVVVRLGRRRLFSAAALREWVTRGCPRVRIAR